MQRPSDFPVKRGLVFKQTSRRGYSWRVRRVKKHADKADMAVLEGRWGQRFEERCDLIQHGLASGHFTIVRGGGKP